MSDPQQQAVSLDAFAPAGIAQKLEAANVARAGLSARKLILLGLLGGLYIGFGGALATLVLTDNTLGYGLGRLAAGLSFSLGLIMLVVAGGELFTGNNLMILAFAGRMITARAMLRNWGLVYGANAAGAALLALAIHFSGILDGNGVQGHRRQDRRGQGPTRHARRVPARHPVQHAGLPGSVAEHGRAQRRGQGHRHRLPDQRVRGAGLRALHRQLLSASRSAC